MPADTDRLGIYFLDVGQGDCTIIVPPAGHGDPILFDCADQFVARCFLSSHRIERLTAVVASHLDIDHVRGMLPFLLEHFEQGREVGRLFIGLDRIPPPDGNRTLRDLIAHARDWERNPPHANFSVEPPLRTGAGPVVLAEHPGDWRIELVLPFYGTTLGDLLEGGEDPNHLSAVLRVTRGDTAVLIGGDAPLGSWERLPAPQRRAQVIRTPHHGGEIRHHGRQWTEFSDLYDAVQAETAVISAASHFQHGHPKLEHIRAAQRGGACRLLCTQITPRCHLDPTEHRTLALQLANAIEPPYRHEGIPGHSARPRPKESPCAGTVVVSIGQDGVMEVLPDTSGGHTSQLLPRFDAPACLGVPLPTTRNDWRTICGTDAVEARAVRDRLIASLEE